MQGFKFVFTYLIISLSCFELYSNDFLEFLESEMVRHLDIIAESEDENQRIMHSDSLRIRVMEALDISECFEYKFSKIDGMGILTSPDDKIRLFNWNLPLDNEKHLYYCFVLHFDKKEDSFWWEELVESDIEIDRPESKYLKQDQWIGALYYQIIPIKVSKNKTHYTLLGWDGNDRSTTRKIIDVYSVTGGKSRLGAPIFKTDNGTQKRYIIEYGSDVMVSCKWREKEKRIVFDHVAPRDPSMTGIYSFYGPDLTYDAFVLEKDKWVLETNVDVRNNKSGKPYNDPGN